VVFVAEDVYRMVFKGGVCYSYPDPSTTILFDTHITEVGIIATQVCVPVSHLQVQYITGNYNPHQSCLLLIKTLSQWATDKHLVNILSAKYSSRFSSIATNSVVLLVNSHRHKHFCNVHT